MLLSCVIFAEQQPQWICGSRNLIACLSKYISLATHLHRVTYVLLNVERAALLNPDSSKIRTIRERVCAYPLERTGKRNLFDSTVPETHSSDIFYAGLNFKSFEVFAVTKCLAFESLQRRREFDVFYRTPRKNFSFPGVSVDKLFFTELLQSFVQLHAL